MLIELLILSVLLNQECTIYKIRKFINKYFSLFCSASMGSIHPALQKLHESKYVNVKKSMSTGGQKSSVYSITPKGKKYFETLMQGEVPQNPPAASQLVNIKIMLLPHLEKPERKQVIKGLKDYYQNRLLDFENFQHDCSAEDGAELKNLDLNYIKHYINVISEEIEWLKMQELNLN